MSPDYKGLKKAAMPYLIDHLLLRLKVTWMALIGNQVVFFFFFFFFFQGQPTNSMGSELKNHI